MKHIFFCLLLFIMFCSCYTQIRFSDVDPIEDYTYPEYSPPVDLQYANDYLNNQYWDNWYCYYPEYYFIPYYQPYVYYPYWYHYPYYSYYYWYYYPYTHYEYTKPKNYQKRDFNRRSPVSYRTTHRPISEPTTKTVRTTTPRSVNRTKTYTPTTKTTAPPVAQKPATKQTGQDVHRTQTKTESESARTVKRK